MTISTQQLRAYADGELSPEEARAVEAAISADPVLAARLEAEKRLKATLQNHFDPVAQEPVPDSLVAMIEEAQAEDDMAPNTPPLRDTGKSNWLKGGAPHTREARVLDFSAARQRREEERKSRAKAKAASKHPGTAMTGKRGGPIFARPGLAAGLAASLILGLMIGTSLDLGRFEARSGMEQKAGNANIVERDGQLVASGELASRLETQLASAPSTEEPLRILTSFQRDDGSYCRVYSGAGNSGIACHSGKTWVLERTIADTPLATTKGTYRQAGSRDAELMAAAQEIAKGRPLDAEGERAARDKGWTSSATTSR